MAIARRGVFVTGTGTEVGKSVLAAVLAAGERGCGGRVGVFKPAVSGLEEPGESDHALLRRASGTGQSDDEIAPYRYRPAVSPHLAAELAGERIDPDRLLGAAAAAGAGVDLLVCEGVGGLLVPLAGAYLVADLIAALGLPAVIVAPAGLGTINHTLLTIEACRARSIDVAAVVLNRWPDDPGPLQRSNLETIAELGRVRVETLGELELADPAGWPALRIV